MDGVPEALALDPSPVAALDALPRNDALTVDTDQWYDALTSRDDGRAELDMIPLGFCARRDTHQARPVCFVGTQNDRPDLLAWARILPCGYRAWFRRSRRHRAENADIKWPYCMEIHGPIWGDNSVLLFELFFVPDLSRFVMYYQGPEYPGYLAVPRLQIQILHSASSPGSYWLFGFPVAGAMCDPAVVNKRAAFHPYRRIRRRLFRGFSPNLLTLRVFLDPHVAIALSVRARNEWARQHLGSFLMQRSRGSVKVYYSERTGTPMVELAPGQYLYALTIVFPWALRMLMVPPNCTMTDTTFFCVRPYTLALLHVIIANASIPIALGVAPSEAAPSYIRIYDHIHDIMDRHYPGLRRVSPLPSVAPRGRAPAATSVLPQGFFRAPDVPDEEEEQEEIDEHAEEVDRPVTEEEAPPVLGDPALVNEDPELPVEEEAPPGSGDPAAPLVDDDPELAVEEEDGPEPERFDDPPAPPQIDPVAVPVRDDAIETVIEEAPRVQSPPDKVQSALTRLPIVTDLGPALAAFVQHFDLDWKLCWRHITEMLGAKSLLAVWVMRLLYSWTPETYARNCETIQYELDDLDKLPKKLNILKLMMGEPGKPHPLSLLSRWAAYLRYGQPTTANHGEGRHAQLNHTAKPLRDFIELLLAVIDYCTAAYNHRNDTVANAYARNVHHMHPREGDPPSYFDPDRIAWYKALHTIPGRAGPDPHPQIDLGPRELWFPDEWSMTKLEGDLPPSWEPKKVAPAQEQTRGMVHRRGCRTRRDEVAWEIVCELHRQCRDYDWKRIDFGVDQAVARIATEVGIGPNTWTTRDEATWRTGTRTWLREQLAELRKTSNQTPAQ
jgi:hypothetical protein